MMLEFEELIVPYEVPAKFPYAPLSLYPVTGTFV